MKGLRPENIDLNLLSRINAEDSLAEFIKQAWKTIEPTTPLRWARHLDAIAEHLEAVAAGEIRQLLINVMPRSGKSLWTSVFFPVWLWLKHPEERLVFASYSSSLAVKLSTDRRSIIQSGWFQRNWGLKLQLADDANLKSEFQNKQRGHMIATSVGASITGRGGNYVIADDLINPDQANSDTEREGAIRWFDETLGSRLDDKRTGRIIVIEQRTHQADLSGHLLAQGGWTHLLLPAQFDERTVITMPRSGKALTWDAGTLLWPEREGERELAAARERLGSFAYGAQYQQNPTPREGALFRREWLRSFAAMPQKLDRVVLAVDSAFKTTTTADYSAIVVIGEVKALGANGALPGYYVLSVWRGRVEFAALKRMVIQHAGDYRPNAVVVEDAASGQSLIQELRVESGLPVIPLKPDRDKLSRAAAVSPVVEGGRLFLPAADPGWCADFTAELLAFPGGRHDDQVDALVWALDYLRHRPSSSFSVTSIDEFFLQARLRGEKRAVERQFGALPADWLQLSSTPVAAHPGESEGERRAREIEILANLDQARVDYVSRGVCMARVRELLRSPGVTLARS